MSCILIASKGNNRMALSEKEKEELSAQFGDRPDYQGVLKKRPKKKDKKDSKSQKGDKRKKARTVQDAIVRLAFNHPEYRDDLLALLKPSE